MVTQPTLPTRVLVVDDEHLLADFLTTILQQAGFETTAAYDGTQALEKARVWLPDMVISDHSMPPGISGMEACVAIKQMLPACRVILLSGQALGEEFAPYRQCGYDFVLLSKPIHPTELLKVMAAEEDLPSDVTEQGRILLVDSIGERRASLFRLLSRAGFEVHETAAGEDTLPQAVELRPDLVLLDVDMPDCEPSAVSAALKGDSRTAHINLVHVTSSRTLEHLSHLAHLADDLIVFPVAPISFIKRIRELLQIRYLRPRAS